MQQAAAHTNRGKYHKQQIKHIKQKGNSGVLTRMWDTHTPSSV